MSNGPTSINSLLTDLDSPDPQLRDAAALQLLDLAESAVDALFRASGRPENRNHCGTLVHVLSAYNCGDRFSELFGLALQGNYEVQCHALSILQSQWFSVTARQLREARRTLGELREREGLPAEDVGLLRDELQAVLSRLAPLTGDPA